jgi:flagellar motility protein MotE (MotC chaperone)
MNFFRRVNIFTFLLAVAVFAFVMRLVDVADYSIKHSAAESSAPAQKLEPVAQNTPAPASAPAATSATMPASSAPAPAAASTTPPVVEDQSAAPPPSGDQGFSASELETLQSLAKRRDELDKREQAISQREALLKAASGEVDRKIAELNKIRGELEDLLNKQKTAEDERINSLVKIYENMKPKDAANIFNTLEMDVLLPVIAKISERKASPILAAMDPEKARQVTIKLAEQKKLPQLPDDSKKAKPAAPAAAMKQ